MLHPDRRLAVRDEANGPVYLISASFVDYFLIHYKNDLHVWKVWGAWIDFAPNSLLGRSDSLLARINSLLGRVGNSVAWCAYFEHAPFPNGRLPNGLAADLIHSLLACQIP